MSESNPLIEVSENVRSVVARGGRVAVIFDLDSTLFCVSPRTEAILRSLGSDEAFSGRYGESAAVLRDISVLPTDWGIREPLLRRAPATSMEVFLEIRDHWHRHFFSSAFLNRDTIYPFADEYVRLVASLGASVLYLTGRGEVAMREGTVSALGRWGFPLSSSALIMKPSDVVTDESFKALELQKLAPLYDVVWFFENEPVIIEHVRRLIPSVRVVFMDSVHAGRAIAPMDLPRIGMSYVDGVRKK